MASFKAQIHSAEHIFWAFLKELYPTIKTEAMEFKPDKLRLDYRYAGEIDEGKINNLERSVNEAINKNLPVKIKTMLRKGAAKLADLSLLPKSAKNIRIVKIGSISTEACAGEHIKNTLEIGNFKILEIKKRGKDRLRVYIAIEKKMKTKKQTIQAKVKIIKPQPPKGFRDFYGPEIRLRRQVINIFQSVFESYGYEPLETPAMEYAETILGKYGKEADKLVYRLQDPGGRELALMFEMTASACRFVAQNRNKLIFPFKRYQIQKAWRAEKPQKGRFREFIQCDADIWGTTSVTVDAEFMEMGTIIMQKLGFKDFVTRINNRKLINAIAKYAGATNKQFYDIMISVDKLAKIGIEGVREELEQRGIDKEVSSKLLEIVNLKGENRKLLAQVKKILAEFPEGVEGVEGIEELEQIFDILVESGFNKKFFRFDPSIIRGLAYYTGPVWEVEVIEGGVGSVAGCGRYDTLTKMISGVDIPASGGSFGIERICEVLKDRRMVSIPTSIIKVLVTIFSTELAPESRKIARQLRTSGINTEVYIEPNVKLDKQLKYADRKGIPYVVIMGPEEVEKNKVTVKNMKTGSQKTLSVDGLQKEL